MNLGQETTKSLGSLPAAADGFSNLCPVAP